MGGSPLQHRACIGVFSARMLSPSWQPRSSGSAKKSEVDKYGGKGRSSFGFPLGVLLKVLLLISVIGNVEIQTANTTFRNIDGQQQGFIIQGEGIISVKTVKNVTKIVSKASVTRLSIPYYQAMLGRVSATALNDSRVTSPSIRTELQSRSSVLHCERMLSSTGTWLSFQTLKAEVNESLVKDKPSMR